MLTSIHAPDMVNTGWKDRQTWENIQKPKCVLDYNKNVGGVDLSDTIITDHLSFSKSVKWYKKLFFFFCLMYIALLIANVLHDKQYRTKTTSFQFKMEVEKFFENYGSFRMERQFMAKSISTPLRISGRHFFNLCVNERGEKCRWCRVIYL